MGVFSHSVTAAVDPAVVWERWTDVEHWPVDDPTCRRAQLNGPLAKGAIGWVQAKGSRRKNVFRIVEVDRQHLRFVLEGKLVLGLLTFEHTLVRPDDTPDEHESAAALDPDLWVLTHTVTISGRLAKVWDLVVGRTIARSLPVVVNNIVDAAAV